MLALFPKVPKTQCPKALKIDVFDYPIVVWREYPHKTCTEKKLSHWATSSPPIVWVCRHSHFLVSSQRRMFCAMECVTAVQGHPMSLILVLIESAYATSY